jgi:hypothetical protein
MKSSACLVVLAAVLSLLGSDASRRARSNPDASRSGLVTLYARDPLAHDFSFSQGRYGGVFEEHMRKNAGADLDFSANHPGEFTVGIEGTRRGSMVDLGTWDALRQRYGYFETAGGGQGFASIRREGYRFVILKNYEAQTTQTLKEGNALLRNEDHVAVAEDHVYLVRLRDISDPAFELVVKFMVVDYEPGRTVTLRWSVID